MSERALPAIAFGATLAAAALAGAAAARGHHGTAMALAGALTALVAIAGRRVGRAIRADSEAARRLAALVDQRTSELEQRGRDLAANTAQLQAASAHLCVTDRLAAVGRLASGVAHEINTPLAVALTNMGWLREALPGALRLGQATQGGPSAEELMAALNEAEEAGQRVARIVRDLLDFAQERADAPGAHDLVPLLQHVRRLVAHEVRARARLVIELPDEPLFVSGSSARLAQLFAHLLLHAAYAIEEGRAEENEVRIVARAEERGALVEVSDTGRALAPEALAHVFDPFYAAWSGDDPKGGLGLAVCHGLVGGLGGDIAVESVPGRGSVYRVRLPAAASKSRLALGPRGASRPRVLVVDDEPLLCASLYRVLSRDFDVVPHTSARHALSLVRAGEHFDAVLCDLMMPEMSGIAFHEELALLRPALAAQLVFLTGGAFTPAARDFLERVPNPRVQKPFDPAELVTLVGARCKAGAAPGDGSSGC